jgi:drug/metabolite transporter (DMT)-like permease
VDPPSPPSPRRPDAVAFLLLLVLGALWGLTPAIGKAAFGLGATPLAYVFRAALVAAAALFGVGLARGRTLPLDAQGLRFHFGSGLIGFAVPNLIGFLALRHVPAGLFAIVIPAAPLLTFALSAALGLERPTWRRVGGVAVALAGTLLALSPGAALPAGGDLAWAAASLAVPACYACSNVFAVRFRPPGADPLALACGTAAGAAAWLALAALVPGEPWGPLALGRTVRLHDLLAAGQGLLTAVAYAVYFRLLTRHGGVFASQVGYVLVLTGLGWGALIFGEVPGPLVLPATALIFAGLALATGGAPQGGQTARMSGSETATTTTSSGRPSRQ